MRPLLSEMRSQREREPTIILSAPSALSHMASSSQPRADVLEAPSGFQDDCEKNESYICFYLRSVYQSSDEEVGSL